MCIRDSLKKVEKDLGRPLTDSEVFGFAQINSEHCRHKIFGGTFIIDGVEPVSYTQLVLRCAINCVGDEKRMVLP